MEPRLAGFWQRKRLEPFRRAAAVVFLLGIGFTAGKYWQHSREFHWRGRTLTQWAHQMTAHPVEYRKTARELGPALVPYLVREIDEIDGITDGTLLFRCLCAAYSTAPACVRDWLPEPTLQTERRLNAVMLLGDIGPDAKTALPTLIRLLDDENVADSVLASLRSMGLAAKPAVPRVSGLLQEPRPFVLTTLFQIGADEPDLLPLITRAKTNGPLWLRAEAAAVSLALDKRELSKRMASLSPP